MDIDASVVFRVILILLACLFPIMLCCTYWQLRHRRRQLEITRVLQKLEVDPNYIKLYAIKYRYFNYIVSVSYTVVLSITGLSLLLFANELGLDNFPKTTIGEMRIPQDGSRFIVAMGFIGAYIWGLQHILRRYSQNDLLPVVFYSFCLRMVLAPMLAMLVYITFGSIVAGEASQPSNTAFLWPATGFMIGMFPQRGLRWLSDHLPLFKHGQGDVVNALPLDLIEGIEIHDKVRLEEVSIDSCYDLANADFVPLILNTPYNARELIDWIMQAKLCVYTGQSIIDLRNLGIRTILDLLDIDNNPRDFEKLASETSVTITQLESAYKSVCGNSEILRMRDAGILLGQYANIELDTEEAGTD